FFENIHSIFLTFSLFRTSVSPDFPMIFALPSIILGQFTTNQLTNFVICMGNTVERRLGVVHNPFKRSGDGHDLRAVA
ncbi:TPA: hypothetical protein ACGK5A_005100, partial [Escherichia coli]